MTWRVNSPSQASEKIVAVQERACSRSLTARSFQAVRERARAYDMQIDQSHALRGTAYRGHSSAVRDAGASCPYLGAMPLSGTKS